MLSDEKKPITQKSLSIVNGSFMERIAKRTRLVQPIGYRKFVMNRSNNEISLGQKGRFQTIRAKRIVSRT